MPNMPIELRRMRTQNHELFRKKSTPRRDKIIMAMQDPENLILSEDLEKYKQDCLQAFTIMSRHNQALKKTVNMVCEATGCCLVKAYVVINDASYIFGDIINVDKMFMKAQQRERLNSIIRKLKEAVKPDYKLILEAEKLLMQLDELHKAVRQVDTDELVDLTIPAISFTDNPDTMIQDVDFEAINDEEE